MSAIYRRDAYAATEVFETALIEGKVKVRTANEDMTLYPEDKAVLQNGVITRKHIDDMESYRWRDGLYCFKDLSFDDVLKQFEIYYDVRFVKENQQIANPKLNGQPIIRMKNKMMMNAALYLQSSEKKKEHSPFDWRCIC